MSGRVILITGAMAAGKSTVAQALAERLPMSVHLRGDAFRRMIVNGRAEMNIPLSEEAEHQLSLRYELAVAAARRYAEAGFSVVYQDIIVGPALARVVDLFEGIPLDIVVLCPSAETLGQRERDRLKTGYRNQSDIAALDTGLREKTPRLGFWLDTSYLSVEETVQAIVEQFALPLS